MGTTATEARLGWNAKLFAHLFDRWRELTGESPERFAADVGCSRSRLGQLRTNRERLPSIFLGYRIALRFRETGRALGDPELAAVETDDFVIDE